MITSVDSAVKALGRVLYGTPQLVLAIGAPESMYFCTGILSLSMVMSLKSVYQN